MIRPEFFEPQSGKKIMTVLAFKLPADRGPQFSVPAIRTPQKFAEARDFVISELAHIQPNSVTHDDMRTMAAVQAVSDAMDASPFVYRDGAIVSKGFSPRIVH